MKYPEIYIFENMGNTRKILIFSARADEILQKLNFSRKL